MVMTLPYVIASLVIIATSVPLILGIVPPNNTYGFRTPSTMKNPDLWYRANAFCGWALLIAGLVGGGTILGVASGLIPDGVPSAVLFLVPIAVAIVASFIYLGRIKGEVGSRSTHRKGKGR